MGKRGKKFITIVLAAVLFFASISPISGNTAVVHAAAKIKLSKKSVTLRNYKAVKVKIKNLPKKAKTKWSVKSGKAKIKITAKKRTYVKFKAKKNASGSAKILAKVKVPGKKLKKYTIKVKVKIPKKVTPASTVTATPASVNPDNVPVVTATPRPLVTPTPEPTDEPDSDWEPTPEPTLPPHIQPEGEASFDITEDGVLTGGNFKNVYSVTIPDGVKEIGEDAFAFCHTIEQVELPEGLVTIDDRAFNECTRLAEIVMPSTLRTIGKEAFFECTRLETVRLNDGLISIGAGSFFQCSALKEIEVPGSVTFIGDYAFAWDKKMETAQIDAQIDEIPRELFDGCEKIKTIEISSDIKKIGARAFADTQELEGFTLPTGLESIGRQAFEGSVVADGIIDARIIEDEAFEGACMDSIKFSDNVETIGEDAFCQLRNFGEGEQVDIPASVTEIGERAFDMLPAKEYTVESGNPTYTSVDGSVYTKDKKTLLVFAAGREDRNYTIPQGTEEIASYALDQAMLKGTVTIPEGVTKLHDYAMSLSEVDSIILPSTLKSIGKYAVQSNVTELILPDSLTEIGDFAFASLGELSSVDIPEGVKKIGFSAFHDCYSLTSITIPASVLDISATAFSGCTGLDEFKGLKFAKKSDFEVKDGILYSDDKTKMVADGRETGYYDGEMSVFTVPDGVTELAPYLFGMSGYNMISVPDTVETIGDYALGYGNVVYGKENSEQYVKAYDFHILASCKAAIDYAKQNSINILSAHDKNYFDENTHSIKEYQISLRAGDTYDMEVEGLVQEPVYTSSDKKIATVDDKGHITAVANGNTCVIASVGTLYFPLDITVSGGNEPDRSDEIFSFRDNDEDSVSAWEEQYRAYNSAVWFAKTDYPGINIYSSNLYNEVQAPLAGEDSAFYQSVITSKYGKDGGKYFTGISRNIIEELSETQLDRDMMLYSGKSSVLVSMMTKNGKSAVEDLVGSIGTTKTYHNFMSTSLYCGVADGFSSSYGAAIFEIEAKADKTPGMFIRMFAEYPSETELMLNTDTTFKITDAGVKRFYTYIENEEDGLQKLVTYKPFIKMEIVS